MNSLKKSGGNNGWATVRLGDVVVHRQELEREPEAAGFVRFLKVEHLDADRLQISRWGRIEDGDLPPTFYKVFRRGQVLFPTRNPHLRRVVFAEFEGICGEKTLTLEAGKIDTKLLPFVFQSDRFWTYAQSMAIGSTNPHVRWRDVAAYTFPLPPPPEQEKVARILWSAEYAIERVSAAIESSLKARNVLAAHLLRKGLANARLIDSPIGEIPHTWKVVPLAEVADVRYGLTINRKRETLELRRPYLRVANVHRGYLDLSEMKEVGCDQSEVEGLGLAMNDLLVVEGHADVHEIGRAAIWSCEIDECLHQNHILRVRCHNDLVPEFALAWMNSPRGRSYFYRFSQSTSGLNTINSTVLRKMLIPLPPRDIQQEVCNHMQDFDKCIEEQVAHLDRLKQMSSQLREHLLFPAHEIG
ncbi:hypothetical protein GYB59_13560, partial [bacterium]|nr:hypothetical protein [bacterium]